MNFLDFLSLKRSSQELCYGAIISLFGMLKCYLELIRFYKTFQIDEGLLLRKITEKDPQSHGGIGTNKVDGIALNVGLQPLSIWLWKIISIMAEKK